MHVHTPGRSKKIGPNLQWKVVNAPLQAESALPEAEQGTRVQFLEEIGEIWAVGEVI